KRSAANSASTASWSTIEPVTRRARGSTLSTNPPLRSSSTTTSCPASSSARATCAPRNPAPPVTKHGIRRRMLEPAGARVSGRRLRAGCLKGSGYWVLGDGPRAVGQAVLGSTVDRREQLPPEHPRIPAQRVLADAHRV